MSAVASRTPEHVERFGRDFGIPFATTDEAAAVRLTEVDAVYIATPPSEHLRQALIAIEAGKAVLIEKPFATTASEARQIVAAARAGGVFCMEAMWTRFMPLLAGIRSVLADGTLGEVRGLSGSFGISNAPDATAGLFDPARGGGALLHRGIYPLSLARHLLGPVTHVQARARMGEAGVDEDVHLVLDHDNGAISSFLGSLRAPLANDLEITGTHGRIAVEAPIFRPFRARLYKTTPRSGMPSGGRFEAVKEGRILQRMAQARLATAVRGRPHTIFRPFEGNGYGHEAVEVARCLQEGWLESPLMPLDESVEIMEIIDAARAQF